MKSYKRYAIYHLPHKEWSNLGAQWLAYNIHTGAAATPCATQDAMTKHLEWTKDPKKYGFHATIKAPFTLHPDQNEATLISAFEQFCRRQSSFEIGMLNVKSLGRFLALCPLSQPQNLTDLAAEAVQFFTPFRKMLSDEAIKEKEKKGHSTKDLENLRQWGYPYVFDRFRYHLSLTGRIDKEKHALIKQKIDNHFATVIHKPLALNTLSLVGEEQGGKFIHILSSPMGKRP